MLSAHAVLYLSDDYRKMCEKIAYQFGYVFENFQDIGFAEIQNIFMYIVSTIQCFFNHNLPATNKKLIDYEIQKFQLDKFYLPYE